MNCSSGWATTDPIYPNLSLSFVRCPLVQPEHLPIPSWSLLLSLRIPLLACYVCTRVSLSPPFFFFTKALLVASTRLLPLPATVNQTRPDVLCSWRTAVGSIYSSDHPPPPTWTTVGHDLEGAREVIGASPRSLGSAPGKRILPPFGQLRSVWLAGPWHFNGVPALFHVPGRMARRRIVIRETRFWFPLGLGQILRNWKSIRTVEHWELRFIWTACNVRRIYRVAAEILFGFTTCSFIVFFFFFFFF